MRHLFAFVLLAPLAAQDPAANGAFSWSDGADARGPVAVPEVGRAGWLAGPDGVRYRSVPPFAGDPTFEVVVPAPGSGHPTLAERLLLQFPGDLLARPLDERALVVGFHDAGVGERDVFANTELPYVCAERGWVLVAPYGLVGSNYGNAGSQESLRNILETLYELIPFNDRRIYTVGFAMGGLNALSFAMRHQDPSAVRIAGVVCHSPTLDLVRAFEEADAELRSRLSDSHRFGGTPEEVPFEYERVSPARFGEAGLVDPDSAPVVHLDDVPIWLHVNLADPNATLLDRVLELERFLVARGARVHESLVFDPRVGHAWGTLPLRQVFETLGAEAEIGGVPKRMDTFADRPGRFGFVEVRSGDDGADAATHARFVAELAPASLGTPNSFRLVDARGVDRLAVRTDLAGLDPARALTFEFSAADGTADTVVLTGYSAPPRRVTVDGKRLPSGLWSWDGELGELTLVPTFDGAPVRVVIHP